MRVLVQQEFMNAIRLYDMIGMTTGASIDVVYSRLQQEQRLGSRHTVMTAPNTVVVVDFFLSGWYVERLLRRPSSVPVCEYLVSLYSRTTRGHGQHSDRPVQSLCKHVWEDLFDRAKPSYLHRGGVTGHWLHTVQ